MNFEGAKNFILNKLSRELDPRLTYHSIGHTQDVHDSAIRIARLEKISERDILLLRTAALYHDSGMLITYRGHEEASIHILRDVLPEFNYSKEEILRIEGMIQTTKLPQSADEKLSMILCDADLDYLGRPDYFMISHQLKYEWDILNLFPTTLREWYDLQINFLENHRYFTRGAKETREEKKLTNLAQIKDILARQNHDLK
jgi:hypothetical protein